MRHNKCCTTTLVIAVHRYEVKTDFEHMTVDDNTLSSRMKATGFVHEPTQKPTTAKRLPVSFPGLIPTGPVADEMRDQRDYRREDYPWLNYILKL